MHKFVLDKEKYTIFISKKISFRAYIFPRFMNFCLYFWRYIFFNIALTALFIMSSGGRGLK